MKEEIENEIDRAYVAGFAMGEGCFHIGITSRRRGKKSRLHYTVRPIFVIVQAEQDSAVLNYVQKVIGFGTIHQSSQHRNRNANNTVLLMISGVKRCKELIPLFDKYKLHGQKQVDYDLWKNTITLMDSGAHLTVEGFLKIAELRDQMNLRGVQGKPNPRYRDVTFFRKFFNANKYTN
ncbi:MAG: LAGLIDADG family homing endonuclease [archaeon]